MVQADLYPYLISVLSNIKETTNKMRLIEIKQLVNIAYENFKPKYDNSNGNYFVDNVIALKVAIQSLYDAGIIERDSCIIADIFTTIDSSMTDRIILNGNQINNFKSEIAKLQSTITVLHNWINRYVPDEEDEETINIKLPQLYKMDDLTKASTIINRALSQSVSEIGGELKIKHLEYGSSWIIISVGAIAAAKLVIVLANAAFKVAQKYYGIKMIQQQYDRYSMGTDMLKTIKEANEKIIADEIRGLAENIEKEFYEKKDNERVERLRVSITEMTKLIELGGEIHPSLIIAQDNKSQIPDYKSLLGIIKSAGELPPNEELKSEREE